MLPDGPRQQLRATLGDTSAERRHDRLQPLPCSACGHDSRVMLRTEYVRYFRCDRCSAMCSMAKPEHAERFGT
jgi:hypothetical protein